MPCTLLGDEIIASVRRQLFLDALPDEFDRQTFIEVSSRLDMPLSTAERNIKKRTEEGLLERMDLGRYRKVKKTHIYPRLYLYIWKNVE